MTKYIPPPGITYRCGCGHVIRATTQESVDAARKDHVEFTTARKAEREALTPTLK